MAYKFQALVYCLSPDQQLSGQSGVIKERKACVETTRTLTSFTIWSSQGHGESVCRQIKYVYFFKNSMFEKCSSSSISWRQVEDYLLQNELHAALKVIDIKFKLNLFYNWNSSYLYNKLLRTSLVGTDQGTFVVLLWKETHLCILVTTSHLMCQRCRSNPGPRGERSEC